MTKKLVFLSVAFVLSGSSAFASQTAGLCEETAVTRALETAPGVDPSSPASLTSIRLIKTEKLAPKTNVERYYVATEDQGGPAASIISVKVTDKSSLKNDLFLIDCEVIAQTWVE